MKRLFLLLLLLGFALPVAAQEAPAQDADTTARPVITPETHDAVMGEVLGTPKHDIRTIGILVYDGVNDLDVLGPKYVLAQIMGAETHLISTEPGSITTVMGTEIVPDTVMADVGALDILVVPGGFRGTVEAVYDSGLHDWIRRVDETTTYTAAVCTGGWVLAATGLLDGRRATTNWYRAEEMLAKHGATFTDDRYTQDGKYWTAAGVTAGMDMALAMLVDLYGGPNYAQGVMLDMEYDPAPPIEGGSPEATDPDVLRMMKAMYDMGVLPLMEQLEAERAAPSRAAEDTAGFWVRHVGDRRALLHRGDLSARIALDSLAGVTGLYAVGPVEGLQGEVTIYDGEPSISTVENGRVRVDSSFEHRAAFLVYASATEWTAVPIERPIRGLDEAEAFVRAAAEDAGLDLEAPFPFRIEGRADTLTYHVIFKTDDAPHDRAAHHKAKQMFSATDRAVEIVGFWADAAGEGVYTHPGRRTHLHARLADGSASGHVDDLALPAGATLYLPR